MASAAGPKLADRRARAGGLLAALILVAGWLAVVPAAFAGVGLGVTPTFPANVTVGQTGDPASLLILNTSTPPESAGNVTIAAINLVAACGTNSPAAGGDCPSAQADPGVFALSGTGVGEAGTACAGQTFTIAIIDAATGQVSFTPSGGPVVLGSANGSASVPICGIDFTFSVSKAPTRNAGAGPPLQTAQLGFASGRASDGFTGSGIGSSSVTVALASPGITTTATPNGKVGTPITDTAHLAAAIPPGPAPTGTITFKLFGPTNATCTGLPTFTSTVPVSSGVGNYTSAPFTPATVGTYRWIAAYSGDANNVAAITACGDANETTAISPATPTVVTTASAPTGLGGTISDSATLAGGFNPTGTITFTVFGPNNPTCTGSPAFTLTATVAGSGTYSSGPFTPTATGSYNFVAVYGGDGNNASVTSACGAANETATVNKATPTIVTTASGGVAVGGTISDSAALGGGVSNPTGTITFDVFGPSNPTCSGAPAFTSTTPVTGNGTYGSGTFPTTLAGTYLFVASYSGDGNNNPVTSACGSPNESVVVNKAIPAITTTASPSVHAGGAILDTATLTGGVAPTGTITFTLFGPSNATCSGAPIFSSTKPVSGSGTYPSDPFTTSASGTYNWVASYSGDANNAAATSSCGAPNESVTVTSANLTIVTHASSSVAAGNPITDTATLSGGTAPTGTITFTVFGPSDATCSGAVAFTSTRPVNGNGNYTSASFTPTAAGTYRFVAVYSGDASNSAATTACNDVNESVVVTPAGPAIVTHASPSVIVGGNVSDTATLSGGVAPTGTIAFTLFGPNNATCTGAPIFTNTVAVTGNANYPSSQFATTTAGTYRFIAAYSGDANNAAVTTACGDANESVVVAPVTPAIVTQASAAVTVGQQMSDTATLSGAASPTGTMTFTAFGPTDATCASAPAFTSVVTVSGNGPYSSGPFLTSAAGTYRFVAAYSGDTKNASVTTLCNDPNESVVVAKASPAVATAASPSVPAGGAISDTATLSGGVNPTGTISFKLFGPSNPTCTGAAIFTSTKSVTGNGVYPSDSFTTTAAGTYDWEATYSGDANNGAVALTACAASGETVNVTKASPTIVTHASSSVAAGSPITDTATLSGGTATTGTITFTVFGPSDATCSGTAVFTSTKPVNGNGNYTSDPFTATLAGTYRLVAAYSGDANNAPATTACNDANESVVVAPASAAIVTHASAPAPVGGTIRDTATLSGGVNPTGTVTFKLFGPNNATCTGAPIFTSSVPVAGNGNYTSAQFTPTSAGTYEFAATYSGDANNAAAGPSACADANESVVVTAATPTLSTTASPPSGAGQVTDTATLAGGVSPSGTITFELFGPSNATCTGTPAFTSTVAVSGNGIYTSGTFTPAAAGTYEWVATYSGDASNSPAGPTACSDPAESVTITKAQPTIATTASPGVALGTTALTDAATVSGRVSPVAGATVAFRLYGPADSTCAGAPVFTSTKAYPLAGGPLTSDGFTPTQVGTYRWIASYSGDANNLPVAGACGDANESVVVTKAQPTIATTASPTTIVVGTGSVSDGATVSGRVGPQAGATADFRLFGPDDASCAGTPAFQSLGVPYPLAGGAVSAAFTPTQAGTYRWIASYSGDANNLPVGGACNDANETVVVLPAADLSLTKTASPDPAIAGQQLTYTLTASNAGPNVAASAKITDTLPAGTTFQGASAGCTAAGQVVTCQLGDLAGGASATRMIVVLATAGSPQNTATVSSATADPNPANNTATATTTVGTSCTKTMTGRVRGALIVPAGQFLCLSGVSGGGAVIVKAGGALTITGGKVGGAVSATGAKFVTICGSTIGGLTSVKNSTGMVRIGDDDSSCAGNHLSSALTLSGNTAGVEVFGNTIGGSTSLKNNHGASPLADAAPEVEGNRVFGSLLCSGDTPADTNDGLTNRVNGAKTGECARL